MLHAIDTTLAVCAENQWRSLDILKLSNATEELRLIRTRA